MNTLLIKESDGCIKEESLMQAVRVLREGGLVAFPTETVYGLGANALDPLAAAKIYEAKGRPQDNPLILHIAHKKDVHLYAAHISKEAEQLMDAFWPGPLTMVFPKKDIVPLQTTGGLETVAIRMPANSIAKELINLCGFPIAAPSANISGRPSSTVAADVMEQLNGKVDMILDGGASVYGLESTIVDMTEKPLILRPGFITKEMLSGILNFDIQIYQTKDDEKPRAPGMKYTHYSPRAKVILVYGQKAAVSQWVNKQMRLQESSGKVCAVLACSENLGQYNSGIVSDMGSECNPEQMGNRLFQTLNRLDRQGVDIIYAEAVKREGVGEAYMNRLQKASSETVML